MEGREHIREKIFTPMMTYNADFVNKAMNLSTKRPSHFVDKLLSQRVGVNDVNKVVNKKSMALLTTYYFTFRTLGGMSTMSTKKIVKVYVGTYIEKYRPLYARACRIAHIKVFKKSC